MNLNVANDKLIETVKERTELSINSMECQRQLYILQRKEKALKQKELFLKTYIGRCGLAKTHKSVQYEVVVVGVKASTKKVKVENELADDDDELLVTSMEGVGGSKEEIVDVEADSGKKDNIAVQDSIVKVEEEDLCVEKEADEVKVEKQIAKDDLQVDVGSLFEHYSDKSTFG